MDATNSAIDEDAMNIEFHSFPEPLYPESDAFNNQIPLSGDPVAPVTTFACMDVVALTPPESLHDANSHGRRASIGTRTPELLHQVSISLACTAEQLSNVMAWITNTGLPVNISIETR